MKLIPTNPNRFLHRRRRRSRSVSCTVLTLLLPAAVLVGIARPTPAATPGATLVTKTSTGSGDWSAASTWVPAGQPTSSDDVTILTGHTVNVDVSAITLSSLTVQGNLSAGPSAIGVDAYTILVSPGGRIESPDNTGSSGYRTIVLQNTRTTPGLFRNQGTIKAGDGAGGGSILVRFPRGLAVNRGILQAGNGSSSTGGSVSLIGHDARNGAEGAGTLGQIFGGDGTSAEGGFAKIQALDPDGLGTSIAVNGANSIIRAGDSVGGSPDFGGDALLLAADVARQEALALMRSGDGCPCGMVVINAPVQDDEGEIVGGSCDPMTCGACQPGTTCAQVAPPTGSITGDATVAAEFIDLVAGESLVVGNFSNAPAIDAGTDLQIVMAPGGVLDLRNNPPGTTWLRSGGAITLRCDTVLMDPGVVLANIMSPAPVVMPASRYVRLIGLPGALAMTAVHGQSTLLPFSLSSASNMPELIDYQVTDTAGWLTPPIAVNGVSLPGGHTLETPVIVNVPPEGGATTVTLSAHTQVAGAPSDSTVAVIELATPPEPGQRFCFGVGCPCGNDDPAAGCVTSAGSGAILDGSGSSSATADDLVLTVRNIPSPNANGIIFMGPNALPPFVPASAAGHACTGGGFRYAGMLDDGTTPHELVQTNPVAAAAAGGVLIGPGQTWHFQGWFRDNNGSPCGGASNLSNAYSVTFTP